TYSYLHFATSRRPHFLADGLYGNLRFNWFPAVLVNPGAASMLFVAKEESPRKGECARPVFQTALSARSSNSAAPSRMGCGNRGGWPGREPGDGSEIGHGISARTERRHDLDQHE